MPYIHFLGFVGTENFGTLLKQLVNDLTNPENTCAEVSLLRPLCHTLDLSLLGPALHDMDQYYIEEQVSLWPIAMSSIKTIIIHFILMILRYFRVQSHSRNTLALSTLLILYAWLCAFISILCVCGVGGGSTRGYWNLNDKYRLKLQL